MNAREILSRVANAYRALATVQLEAVMTTESGDENAKARTEQRVRFLYAAPNRMRYEPLGRPVMTHVADGENLHTVFDHRHPHEGGPQVTTTPVAGTTALPHFFRPEFPMSSEGAYFFQDIDQRVADAHLIREEDGCYVIAATYEPSQQAAFMTVRNILFWVDTRNFMVMRQQGEVGHRFPLQDDWLWNRLTMSVQSIEVNADLPDGTFRFTPPPNATIQTPGMRGGFSGGGLSEDGPNDTRRIEHRGWHEWEGDTLVDHSQWKLRGTVFSFERRFTFTDDGSQLRVDEWASGPHGESEAHFDLDLL